MIFGNCNFPCKFEWHSWSIKGTIKKILDRIHNFLCSWKAKISTIRAKNSNMILNIGQLFFYFRKKKKSHIRQWKRKKSKKISNLWVKLSKKSQICPISKNYDHNVNWTHRHSRKRGKEGVLLNGTHKPTNKFTA